MIPLTHKYGLLWWIARWGKRSFTERQLWRYLERYVIFERARVREWLRSDALFMHTRSGRYFYRYRDIPWTGHIIRDAWDQPWWVPPSAWGIPFCMPIIDLPTVLMAESASWTVRWAPFPGQRRWRKWLRVRAQPLITHPVAPARPARDDTHSPRPTHVTSPLSPGENVLHAYAIRCHRFIDHPWGVHFARDGQTLVWLVPDVTDPEFQQWTDPDTPWPAIGWTIQRDSNGRWAVREIRCVRAVIVRWESARTLLARLPASHPSETVPEDPVRNALYPAVSCWMWHMRDSGVAQALARWYRFLDRGIRDALRARNIHVPVRDWTVPVENVWNLLRWLSRRIGTLRYPDGWVPAESWQTCTVLSGDERDVLYLTLILTITAHIVWHPMTSASGRALPIWPERKRAVDGLWLKWIARVWHADAGTPPDLSPQDDVHVLVQWCRCNWPAETMETLPDNGGWLITTARAHGVFVIHRDTLQCRWVPAEHLRRAGFFYKASAWEWRQRGGHRVLAPGCEVAVHFRDDGKPRDGE